MIVKSRKKGEICLEKWLECRKILERLYKRRSTSSRSRKNETKLQQRHNSKQLITGFKIYLNKIRLHCSLTSMILLCSENDDPPNVKHRRLSQNQQPVHRLLQQQFNQKHQSSKHNPHQHLNSRKQLMIFSPRLMILVQCI